MSINSEEVHIFDRKLETLKDVPEAPFTLFTEVPILRKVVEITVLLGALFMLPDQAVTAFDRYATWQHRLLAPIKNHPSERLLLAPPVATIPTLSKLSDDKAQ